MNEMASELKDKTGISAFVLVKKTLNEKSIKDYEKEYSKNFTTPYVLFTFAESEQKIDIINSPELSDKFDKNEVLDDYVIPILIAKDKTNLKYVAAVFNGYAELIDQIAKSYNITLNSSIGSTGKTTYNIVNYLFWAMMFSFVLIFFYVLKRKK